MADLPAFDQNAINACAAISISRSADIVKAVGGAESFYAWFNTRFKGVPDVVDRFPCDDSEANRKAFAAFWDQTGTIFNQGTITGLEFCALMGINLQEAHGRLGGATEKMNKMDRPHPGLAYAFDRIEETRKASYNGGSNRTVLALCTDPLFLKAHGQKAGAAALLNRPGGIDPRWGGDVWPSDVPADPDPAKNGFVMEADFYKFRGRGVIQTTWRSSYEGVIKWVLGEGAKSNPELANIAARWRNAVQDIDPAAQISAIATISTNADWDLVFQQGITLAKGVAIFSASKSDFLRDLKKDPAILDGDKKTKGSLRFFASRINGGDYPEHVLPKMKALIRGLAKP